MRKTIKEKKSEYEKFISNNYEKMSLKKMTQILNISDCSGYAIMKRLGLKTKPNRYFVTFKLNENYFENIDSADKAYFLGLLYADGNIHQTSLGRKRFQIALHKNDEYILNILKEYLAYNGKLYNDRNCKKLMFHNIKIFDDLKKHGCVENKSLILTYPTFLSPDLTWHFVRGYFDGDGSISLPKNKKNKSAGVTFTGTQAFTDVIREILTREGIKVSRFYIRYKNQPFSAGSINIYFSKKKNKVFYDLLYKDCENLYLRRKKDKFETILNN